MYKGEDAMRQGMHMCGLTYEWLNMGVVVYIGV